ncbi:MAG: hypothetical protein P8M07_07000, partial [Flavobacteriales bacterium]|nr:hypothetical protein [Flavobacteriales bacterium]
TIFPLRACALVVSLLFLVSPIFSQTVDDCGIVYACTNCVFVDADEGSDIEGDGTALSPFQTMAHADQPSYDGMVLRGVFDLGSDYTFTSNRSYTGYGSETVFEVHGGLRHVNNNSFHRLVFDFNHTHETASFTGGPLGLYNVVIKDQHTTNNGRELLFGNGGDLTVSNCLLYDVEYNAWEYGSDHTIDHCVSSECDGSFTLAGSAPNVTVEPATFQITSGGSHTDEMGYGVWGANSTYTWELPECVVDPTICTLPRLSPPE